MNFSTRLKEEIEFADLRYKELSEKSGVPERALYNYVATKNPCMPPADVAVKIADALGVSVEYLVTGKNQNHKEMQANFSKFRKYSTLLNKLDLLSEQQIKVIQMLVSEFSLWEK